MKQLLPETLLPELELLLSKRPAPLAAAIRRVVTDLRPCVRLETTRAGVDPMRGSLLTRLLGRPPASPVLPPTASKFGSVPYIESMGELAGGRFIGQINFAEAAAALNQADFPIPEGMQNAGLLAVDLTPGNFGGRVRWYPQPHESRAVHPDAIDSVAKYETRIQFRGSWSFM